jgi:hypothetical protein
VSTAELAEKIRTLTPEQIAEVDDFIESLRHGHHGRPPQRVAVGAGEPPPSNTWGDSEATAGGEAACLEDEMVCW